MSLRLDKRNVEAGLDVGAGDALRQAEVQSVEALENNPCGEEFNVDELRAIALHMGIESAGEIVDRDRLVQQIRSRL